MDSEGGIAQVESLMKTLGIDGEILRHQGSGASTNDAERELGIDSRFILKTLLLCSKKKDYVGAIISGDRRLKVRVLEQLSGLHSLRFAGRDDVFELTGFNIGGVPPFCLVGKCKVYVDKEVLEREWVVGAAGTDHAGVRFNPESLLRIGYTESEIAE